LDVKDALKTIRIILSGDSVGWQVEPILHCGLERIEMRLCPDELHFRIYDRGTTHAGIRSGKIIHMKTNSEYEKFDSAMRRVLTVSKEELQRRLDAEKLANKDKPKRGPKPKTSASGHAAGDAG
jgi:hypothetical protein